ncbi:ribosomal protein S18-alanine N-acetyltransferase [Streptacidiphilus sp. EB129]|jgi:ribosomal-protein-alanine N-acetyltransferase|uniref:ribosomal protein S18-alanine N-acetyltransferase n=1 Tax=Streptacidiphilus sp. EB129 TaxID=3156262 RepID=UPI003517046E
MTGTAARVDLREMRWWDIEPVLALEAELFPEDAWSAGMFWSELADARHPRATRWYTVAEDAEGRLVGYAGLMAVAGSGDVQTIAVAREHWGTGLGARLLTTLVRQAADAGCTELLLEVRVDNGRAQRLYERFGFQPIGLRRNYYQPSGVDALVMRLDDPGHSEANNVGAMSHDG